MLKTLILSICLVAAAPLAFAEEPVDDLNDIEEIKGEDFLPDGSTAKENAATPEAVQPRARKNDGPPPPPDTRPSAAAGEKIFDWDKHRGETEVAHPFAEKGLIRIGRDGSYYYKVKESDSKRAIGVNIGVFNPVNLKNPDAPTGSAAVTFEENYQERTNPAIVLSKEWQLWYGSFGKLGVRASTGAYVAQGHGHFHGKDGQPAVNVSKEPMEVFTFISLPNSAGVVYRAQFAHRPLFVPYAEGGGIAFTFAELRDDNKPPKFGGALAAYGAAGIGLNLTYFDYLARIRLDHEYGINAVYLTAEYRRIQALTTRYDFTSDFYNAGFLMEY